jgi:hypothetical protein
MTAWSHLQLLDIERLDEFQRDAEDLRSAERVAMAFNEPKLLGHERIDLQRRLAAPFGDSIDATRDARSRGIALAERLARGKVLVS